MEMLTTRRFLQSTITITMKNKNKNKNKSRLQANNSHPASSCRQPPIYIPPFPRLFAQQMKDNRNWFWFVSKYFSPQLAMVNDDLLKVKQRETQETFMRRVKVRPFTFPPIINEKNEKWKFILSLFTTTIIPGKWKYILSPFYHYHHQRLPFLSTSSSHTVKVKVRSFALQMSSVLYFLQMWSFLICCPPRYQISPVRGPVRIDISVA